MITTFQKITVLTVACLGLGIANGYFFDFLNNHFFHLSSSGNDIDKLPRNEQFLIAVIIAPLIETLFAQFMLFKILKLKVTNQVYLILIASLFFASMHYYNWLYVVVTFFAGLILNYYYLLVTSEKSKKSNFAKKGMIKEYVISLFLYFNDIRVKKT